MGASPNNIIIINIATASRNILFSSARVSKTLNVDRVCPPRRFFVVNLLCRYSLTTFPLLLAFASPSLRRAQRASTSSGGRGASRYNLGGEESMRPQ